jgi:hypothetical protein
MSSILDESTRPTAPVPADRAEPGPQGRAVAEHFVSVHDRYRSQMVEVLDLLRQVTDGERSVGAARGELHQLTLRANDWTLGGYCERQCVDLTEHHGIEDQGIFPHLRASDATLAPVLDRLDEEHHVIHDLLTRIDGALVRLVSEPHDLAPVTLLLEQLDATIRSHFGYEEDELLGPLGQYGFYAGQVPQQR